MNLSGVHESNIHKEHVSQNISKRYLRIMLQHEFMHYTICNKFNQTLIKLFDRGYFYQI